MNEKKKYIDLEGFRGFAALGVMLAHGLGFNALDASYKPSGMIPYFSVGGLAVYMFFLLSGFVIAASTNKDNFSTFLFYKKRLVRIYPIYLLTFLLLFFLGTENSIWQTVGNILMLQNSNSYGSYSIPVDGSMVPIWSLNYEMLYYLLFPLLVISIRATKYLVVPLILFSIVGYYTEIFPMFLIDYAIGYVFWLSGLYIYSHLDSHSENKYSFLSYVFLIISFHHFGFGSVLLKAFGLYNKAPHSIGIETFVSLPLCILVISDIAKRRLPFRKFFCLYSYFLPIFFIAYLIYTGRLTEDARWLASGSFFILSLAFIRERKFGLLLLKRLSFVGSISYALYKVHMPLMFLVGKNVSFLQKGSPLAYSVKFVIWTFLTFCLAYILELKIQPKIQTFFFPQKKVERLNPGVVIVKTKEPANS